MTQHTFIIPENEANERIDLVLVKFLPDYSRTLIQTWIKTGLVLINGVAVKSKIKVKSGDVITVQISPKHFPSWEAQAIPISIVYEDDAFLIINKPIGMVVHPAPGNANATLLNALLYYHPDLSSLPRAGILHRLDKNTSGLLIVAKTAASLKNLTMQLKKRILVREYQAVVYGRFISGGSISAPIGRHFADRKRMAVNEKGKTAITHYRILEKYRAHTRLAIRLETGRTHQIRVHMSHLHHPIVGDITYGGRVQLSKNMSPDLIDYLRQFKRQALHAVSLGFTHPVTQKEVRFEAPIPEDMQKLIHLLKLDLLRNPL